MYLRQVTVMLGLIILCMVLLGAGFFSLSYRHQLEEIQTTLDRNAGFISSYANAAITKGDSLSGEDFINYIYSAVRLTDTTVLVCNTKGQILCAAGVNLNEDLLNSSTIADLSVPSWAVNQLLNGKPYSGVTTFGQLLSSKCYLTSEVLSPLVQDRVSGELISSGIPTGFLFVAADATSVLDFLENTFQLFFITAVAVLLISLVICSITVQRMVDPLKGMCAFAHKFAHGEVDTRITEYTNRKDEIGELAIAFNAMADSLAQAEQKRSEFVANVSHELKTPMTTIAGFADGILDGTIPPEKERESLQVISSETRRLSRLVRRMLELSRLQSSERVAAQEQFDVAEVLLRVLVSLESKITEKDLDVQTQLPDGPVMVWGDPDAVTQVCYNLLDNAVKFSSPQGRLTLRITTKAGKAYIAIGNQGETIPPSSSPISLTGSTRPTPPAPPTRTGWVWGSTLSKPSSTPTKRTSPSPARTVLPNLPSPFPRCDPSPTDPSVGDFFGVFPAQTKRRETCKVSRLFDSLVRLSGPYRSTMPTFLSFQIFSKVWAFSQYWWTCPRL